MAKDFFCSCMFDLFNSIFKAPDFTQVSGGPVCKSDNAIAHQLYNRLFTGLIVLDEKGVPCFFFTTPDVRIIDSYPPCVVGVIEIVGASFIQVESTHVSLLCHILGISFEINIMYILVKVIYFT